MPSLTALIGTDSLFLLSLFFSGYLGAHLPAILFFILATQFSVSKLAVSAETWLVSPRWLVVATLVWAATQLVLILVFAFIAGLSDVFFDWMKPRQDALEACGIYVPELSGHHNFSLCFFPTLFLLFVSIAEMVLFHGSVKFHTLLEDDDDGIVLHSSARFPHLSVTGGGVGGGGQGDDDDDEFQTVATPNASFGARPTQKRSGGHGSSSSSTDDDRGAGGDIKQNPPVTGIPLQLSWAALCALSAVVAPSYLGFPLFFLYIVIVGLAVLTPHQAGGTRAKIRIAAYASLLYSSCFAALIMGAQNSLSKSTSNPEVGIASWKVELNSHHEGSSSSAAAAAAAASNSSSGNRSVVASVVSSVNGSEDAGLNIASALFVVLTVLVSRSLLYTTSQLRACEDHRQQQQQQLAAAGGRGATDISISANVSFAATATTTTAAGNNNASFVAGGGERGEGDGEGAGEHDAADAATSWLISSIDSTWSTVAVWLVDFLLSNGPLWIFPVFVITCVSSPTFLSIILLVVVFVASLNFKLFTHYAPAFYLLCSCISVSVYFVNIFDEVPTVVKIIIANRRRDGAALPLVFQGAASGFAAISYVFFRFAEYIGRDANRRNQVKAAAALSKLKTVYWPLDAERQVDHMEAQLESKVVEAVHKLATECPTAEAQHEFMLQLAQKIVPCLTMEEFRDELKPLLLVASGFGDMIVVEQDAGATTAITTDEDGGGGGGGEPPSSSSFSGAAADSNHLTAPADPTMARIASSSHSSPHLHQHAAASSSSATTASATVATTTTVARRSRGASFADPLPILPIFGGGSDRGSGGSSRGGGGSRRTPSAAAALPASSTADSAATSSVELLNRNLLDDDNDSNGAAATSASTQLLPLGSASSRSIYKESAIRHFIVCMTLEETKRKLLVEVFISLFMYIMRYGTYAICVLLVFALSTCQAEIDVFHLPLVFCTILAIQSRGITTAVWPFLAVYLMLLSVWRFALCALDAGTVMSDWRSQMSHRSRSLLGVYASNPTLLYLYIATSLLAVAEWRMQRNREVSLEQWLTRRYDARLLADPRVVRFYRIIGLGALMLVLGYRAVFERSILFLIIMVLFFVLAGLITYTQVRLTVLWGIGMVMACIILILEASVQIGVAAYPDYQWNVECDPGELCAKDLGLRPATANFELTARLLPSFLSVVLFSAMRAWSEPTTTTSSGADDDDDNGGGNNSATTSSSSSSPASLMAGEAASNDDASNNNNNNNSLTTNNNSSTSFSQQQDGAGGGHRRQQQSQEVQFTSLGFDRIFNFALGFLNIAERLLLANLRFVVWATQLLAAVLNPGLLSFMFALAFVFDVRGFILTVFSGVNMLVIYLLRFTLVSGNATDYTRDCLQFVGWIVPKATTDGGGGGHTWRLLLGPMLCFVSSLCYENLRRNSKLYHRHGSSALDRGDDSDDLDEAQQRQQRPHPLPRQRDDSESLDAPLLEAASTTSLPKQDDDAEEAAAAAAAAVPPATTIKQPLRQQQPSSSSSAATAAAANATDDYQKYESDDDDDDDRQHQRVARNSNSNNNNNSNSNNNASSSSSSHQPVRREPEALSGIAVLVRDFAHNCSYELLLLTHLVGSAVCIEHVTGLMHVMQVTVISLIGRVAVTTDYRICILLRIFESVLFLAQATVALEPQLRTLVMNDTSEPSQWLVYCGIGEAQALSIWSAISLIVLRLIQQLQGTSVAAFRAARKASGGFATLQEMLRARNDIQLKLDDTVAESEAHDKLLAQLLDGSDKPKPSGAFAKRLIHVSTFVLPTAVLTFFDGLGYVSMLNAVIIFSGLVMLSNQRRIHWRNHILWNRWIWFCDLIPWVAAVCNLPPVAKYLIEHRIFEVVGLTRNGSAMTLSALRVCLFWSAHLQRRIFEEFDFAVYLREIHSSRLTDAEQHKEIVERIQRNEQAELALVKRQNRERQRRLEEIRRARFEVMSPVVVSPTMAVFEREDTVTSASSNQNGGGSSAPSAFLLAASSTAAVAPPASPADAASESKNTASQHHGKKDAEPKKSTTSTRRNDNDDNDDDNDDDDELVMVDEENASDIGSKEWEGEWVAIDATTAALQTSFASNAGWRDKLGALVDAVTARLCSMSVQDFVKVQEMHPLSRTSQLLYAMRMLIETHTAHMVLVLQLVNCAASGTIFDAVLPVMGLAVAFVRSPWPPTWYWRLCITFSMVSVVVKTVLSLLASEIPFTKAASHWLRVIIFQVPESSSTGRATSAGLFVDLGLDFTILFFVLVHRYQSRRLGLSDECFASGSTQASKALQKSFFENLSSRFGVGVDLYSLTVTIDFISFVMVLFGYYSLFPADTSSSVLDSFKSNLLPGPLVVALLGIIASACIERVVYLMQATRAKFCLHVLVVLAVHGVFIWWRSIIGMSSAIGVILLLLKQFQAWLAAIQLRRGYPMVRRHDPFSTRPGPPFYWIYYIYRGIPFVFEMRTLLDWTFTRTALPCHYWIKLEDIAHEVYLRNIDRYDHSKTNPTAGFATKFIWKLLFGFLVFAGLFATMFFPLMYYSTFNPSLQDNEILETEVQCMFGPISTYFRGRISSRVSHSQVPKQDWISTVRPAFDAAHRSSGSTVELFNIARCSTFNWQISPPALRNLHERLLQTAYPKSSGGGGSVASATTTTTTTAANSSSYNTTLATTDSPTPPSPPPPPPPVPQRYNPLNFRNIVTIKRKGSVSAEGKTAEFVRDFRITEEQAKALLNLTTRQMRPSPTTTAASGGSEPVLLARVHADEFWLPIISSDPNTASLFKEISVECHLEFYGATDPRTNAYTQYTCISCAPLFSLGNTPNSSYPEVKDNCFDDTDGGAHRSRSCKNYNYDVNETHVHISPQNLYFYVINERVPTDSSFLPNVGIIALYSTFVLVIWRFIRGLFAGMAYRVTLEDMQDPDKVKELIDLIYLSRESNRADALLLEEALYFELLDLLRGPDGLLKVTGSRSHGGGSGVVGDHIE